MVMAMVVVVVVAGDDDDGDGGGSGGDGGDGDDDGGVSGGDGDDGRGDGGGGGDGGGDGDGDDDGGVSGGDGDDGRGDGGGGDGGDGAGGGSGDGDDDGDGGVCGGDGDDGRGGGGGSCGGGDYHDDGDGSGGGGDDHKDRLWWLFWFWSLLIVNGYEDDEGQIRTSKTSLYLLGKKPSLPLTPASSPFPFLLPPSCLPRTWMASAWARCTSLSRQHKPTVNSDQTNGATDNGQQPASAASRGDNSVTSQHHARTESRTKGVTHELTHVHAWTRSTRLTRLSEAASGGRERDNVIYKRHARTRTNTWIRMDTRNAVSKTKRVLRGGETGEGDVRDTHPLSVKKAQIRDCDGDEVLSVARANHEPFVAAEECLQTRAPSREQTESTGNTNIHRLKAQGTPIFTTTTVHQLADQTCWHWMRARSSL